MDLTGVTNQAGHRQYLRDRLAPWFLFTFITAMNFTWYSQASGPPKWSRQARPHHEGWRRWIYVEREHWHGGKVVSAVPLRLLGVMIVEKDKPILEMKH